MTRWLLVEAGHTAAQFDPELRRQYQPLKFRRGGKVAKVATARRLAVRLYWRLRRFACPVARSGAWWTQVHCPYDWAPGLPLGGREIAERIMLWQQAASNRWLVESVHRRIQGGEPCSARGKRIL